MYPTTLHQSGLFQATLTVDTLLVVFIAFASIGLSAGTLISLLYVLKVFAGRVKETRGENFAKELESLALTLKELEKKVELLESGAGKPGSEDIRKLVEGLETLSAKVNTLETKLVVLEKRISREVPAPRPIAQPQVAAKPVAKEAVREVELRSLGDLPLYFPGLRFACIITSQGYPVEIYGQGSDEPARLLDILRLYNSQNVSLTRGGRKLEIFYLGEVRDLSVYGILEFSDAREVTEDVITAAKKSISKYFTEVLSKKGFTG